MAKAGIISLGDFQITNPATYIGDWVTGLESILGFNVQFRFAYGSGGTTVRAYLQTSLDEEVTAIDIASVLFAQASETAILNFSALSPRLQEYNPGDGALAEGTAVDGVVGDRFRIKAVVAGTYAAQTLLSVRMNPHE